MRNEAADGLSGHGTVLTCICIRDGFVQNGTFTAQMFTPASTDLTMLGLSS